jgi:HK97 family phage prohead protease
LNKESKNFEFKTIDDEKGSVEAVFSVFNNMDTDGDVMVPGSIKSGFKDNQVPMVFAHKWDQPIGKGVISQDENKAVFKGSFFMDTEAGKEAYALAKGMGDLQEWSFGFRIDDAEVKGFQSEEMEEEVEARFIKSATVYEVSPVLVGANRETYTLAIKSGEEAVYEDALKALPKDLFETQEEAEKRAQELGCSGSHKEMYEGKEYYMPCNDHASYLSSMEKSLRNDVEEKDASEDSESNTSVQGMRFSDEVKDVLAALDSLIVRATSIGELRKGEGRKLSDNATSALRAVQEDLNDAWAEIDQLIEDVSLVPADSEETITEEETLEAETAEAEEIVSEVEESSAEEIVDEATTVESEVAVEPEEEEASEESSEEMETEIAEAEAPVAEVSETPQELMEDDSDLFAETQQILADASIAEIDE